MLSSGPYKTALQSDISPQSSHPFLKDFPNPYTKLRGISEDKAFIIAGSVSKPNMIARSHSDRGSKVGRACITVCQSYFTHLYVMQHLFICAERLEIIQSLL